MEKPKEMHQSTYKNLLEHFNDKISKYSNEELLREYAYLIQGDGEDGYLSDKGGIELELLYIELYSRLIKCGFLENHGEMENNSSYKEKV